MPIDPLGIEANVAIADPLGIETKGVDPLGIEEHAQKLGMSPETMAHLGAMDTRTREYTESLKTGDFAKNLFVDVPGEIGRGVDSLLEPVKPFLRQGMNALIPGAADIPNDESLIFPPLSPDKKGFLPSLYRQAEGLTTKENLAMLPIAPESDLVKLGFLAPAAAGAVEGAVSFGTAKTGAEREDALGNILGQGLFTGLLGRTHKGGEATSHGYHETLTQHQVDPLNIEVKPEQQPPPVPGGIIEQPPVEAPTRQLSPEESVNLQHEMKGLAQGVMYAKYLGKDVQPIVDAADATWAKAHQTGDYQGALAEIATLKSQLSGAKVAKEEGTAPVPTSIKTPGFEAEQTGPSALGAGVVEGRKYPAMSKDEVSALETGLEEPKLSGPPTVLSEFKGETNDGTQMLNRLRNKLPPAEWNIYQKAGIEGEFQGKKVPASSVAKWMEDNGPKVEVHTYGMEGKVSEAKKAYDQMTHDWFDNQNQVVKAQVAQALRQGTYLNEAIVKQHGGDVDKAKRYLDLSQQVDREVVRNTTGPRATSAYSHVSPKDVKKFQLQRLDVTVPHEYKGGYLIKDEKGNSFGQFPDHENAVAQIEQLQSEYPEKRFKSFYGKAEQIFPLWPPDSIHEQLPNTLGWTAYQDLPHEKYGEVRNAVEVQSRWGQWAREMKKPGNSSSVEGKVDHPLLHDYNRLILKAFIEQARKDEKRYVSIPDAETVMMSEGHDTAVRNVSEGFDTKEQAEKYVKDTPGLVNPKIHYLATLQKWILNAERYISQEKGMRLNYDTLLPKIMEELTGQKGEKVELGEHKNAWEDVSNEVSLVNERRRSNLVFRNPDGTPKTSVTGLVYDISKVNPDKFTLFGRDKMKAGGVLEKGVEEPGGMAYRKFDVRTPEGRRAIELRRTTELLDDLGIGPGIERSEGVNARRQPNYTAFNKLTNEQLYDKWDQVKRAKEQSDKEWRQTAKENHPDVGGDQAKMTDANLKHDFVEAAFKELQRRFDQNGVETGFDREAARLERMKEADKKIGDKQEPVPDGQSDYERYQEIAARIKQLTKDKMIGGAEAQKLFGEMEQLKNKNKGMPPTEPQEPVSGLSNEDSAHYDALQLSNPGSMHDVVSRMAESEEFSSQEQALASYLRDAFEHVLRVTKVKPEGVNETGRKGAVYKGVLHEVRLAVGAKQTGSIAFKVLEEGTHAALTWQLEHPVTATQKAAVKTLTSIMERTKDQLPETVKFKLSPEGRRISGEPDSGLAYRYNNLHEFVAGLISDPELQVHLNNIQLEEIPLWKKVWHALLDLLDIKPDSALDHALQELTKVGAERGEGWAESVKDYHAANYEGASTPALRSTGLMNQLTREAPAPASATVRDKRLKDEFMQRYNTARGWSAPRHATADEGVANKLVRYASARQAAPEIAKWMATDVLGDAWQNEAFDRKLGATLVEERLRAVEKSFRKMAERATDPIEREELIAKANAVTSVQDAATHRAALADARIRDSIERHKATVQPMAQRMHEQLGGRLAAMGESTDAFVNLISMISDDVETSKSMIFGSRKGELTNPLKRGSTFNKPTKGTAEQYDLSYRHISERMIRGNYEQVALQDYYKAMVEKGLAVEEKPGVPPTTAKGGKLSPVTIEMRGSGPGMTRVRKLWVRPDLKGELMQALATDQPIRSGAVRLILDAVTEVQVQGPTDALYHTANMLAVLAGSQGSKTWLYDVLRKGTPVGFLDSAIRIGYNAVKAYHEAPETQHLWADISRIGAGREKPVHETMITKGLMKVGVPEKVAKGVQPSTWSSALIRVIDKGGRIAAAKMYDNLVERGLAKSSELDKREFINRMGQYNSRLMPKFEQWARELSLSSFVVAGKNMNRQAMRRLLTNPGFRAANPAAAAKLRVTEALTLVSMLVAVPAIINSMTTGSWKGRAGTPFGAIDTGEDDKATGRPKIIDPLQLLLLRRAMRMTGMEAYRRAQGQGLNAKNTSHEMVKDAIGAYIHPWMGPGARFLTTAATGREPSVPTNEGYLLSKNPNSFAANAWASAKNMNPTLAQVMKGQEEGTGAVQTPVQSAKAAFGFKLGRMPSWEERQTKLVSKLYPGREWEQLNVGEKRAVQDPLNKERDEQPGSRTELGRLASGEKSYWEQAQRDQDLKASLPKHQQKWLDQQGLHLAGFGTEVTLGKIRLPSTPVEKEALMKSMTESYVEAVKSLMGEKWFNDLGKTEKQEVLDKVLARARKPVIGRFKGGDLK